MSESWVKPDWFDEANAESWKTLAHLARERAERAGRAEAEVKRLHEREKHFARVLGDWDAAIERLERDLDKAHRLIGCLVAVTSPEAIEKAYARMRKHDEEDA
jgi:predicted  nucleic acid-binding Zn-ribbon protein